MPKIFQKAKSLSDDFAYAVNEWSRIGKICYDSMDQKFRAWDIQPKNIHQKIFILQKIVQPKKNQNSLLQIENKKSIKMKTSLGDIV